MSAFSQQSSQQMSDHERYDRQIRVWGAEAQARLQNSRVLICGLQNLNIEVVKNLVLAGVSITIQDNHDIVEADYGNNFFLSGDYASGRKIVEVALPNIKALNSHVNIDFTTESLDDIIRERSQFFHEFQVISLAGGTQSQALKINQICRDNNNIIFFWSDCLGENSIFYSDFGELFQYKEDAKTGGSATNPNPPSTSSETPAAAANAAPEIKSISFPSLETILSTAWKDIPSRFFPLSKIFVQFRLFHRFKEENHQIPTSQDLPTLKSIYANLLSEMRLTGNETSDAKYAEGLLGKDDDFLAVCQENLDKQRSFGLITTVSVLGSCLTQEIIKAISLVGVPGFNVFLFEGNSFSVKAVPIAKPN